MHKVNVNLGDQSYPILIGSNLLGDSSLINPYLGKGKLVVVTNEVVAPLYLEAVKSMLGGRCAGEIILPDGEQHKNLEAISEIYDYLLRNKFDRHTTLLALGGGVIGDITGFAAATYQRGIGYIQIPTTLLAHVDSSVGGKTGVNHSLGKNMIGAFYQPRCVLADIRVLDSLPEREIKAGLAEVVKYGLIRNAKFFDWLAENSKPISGLDDAYLVRAIKTCCEMKAGIVAQDEKEIGIRALLNLGHTFGHAIETAAGYGTWLHGETVAMGIVMAADLSRRLGWLDVSSAQRVRTVLEKNFGMPVVPPADISVDQYLDLMSSDKKVEQGEIRFILLKDIGSAVVEGNIAIETLRSTLTAGHGLCGEL
ncbi:MAG TPA: 3-dehydroquinate synthase [Gammaproteobacteria bacterium]|nr:3-dehydroquinate synthase [Gammaproteobacteria bacterium]|tara:strand:- start:366 stop:1463 length:1098 start_codon:yes stop_codon:yes gene_type:complete